MLSQLHAGSRGHSVSGGFFAVLGRFRVIVVIRSMGPVFFMELLGAIRTFEFMAFAGNRENRNGHKKDGKKFHRTASIATHHRNATPKAIFQFTRATNHPATACAALSCAPRPPSLDAVSAKRACSASRLAGNSRNPRNARATASGWASA